MRNRMGKGQVFAFDTGLEKLVEKLREEKGYYPTLKVVGSLCDPPRSVDFIFRSLRRLSEAGRLSEEASLVYATKQKGKNNERKSVKDKKITSAKK